MQYGIKYSFMLVLLANIVTPSLNLVAMLRDPPQLREPLILLSSLDSGNIRCSVLDIELDIHVVAQVGLSAVESARLDNRLVAHDVQLGVKIRPASSTEEVLVVLATFAREIVGLRFACRYVSDGMMNDEP